MIKEINYRFKKHVLLNIIEFLFKRNLKNKKIKWRTDIMAPPLNIDIETKRLIMRHYMEARYAKGARPVAWVTSGAPVEFLKALSFHVIYPENHGAICGARKVATDIIEKTEEKGFSKDICSYAKVDIGVIFGAKSPIGKLPPPDMLLCCSNICQTVVYWYQVVSHLYNVPLVIIDTPFIYQEAEDHWIEYVKKQIEEAIIVAERISRKTLSFSKLKKVLSLSQEATLLWKEFLEKNKHIPAPVSVFDQFIHMAPIVEMRGEESTVKFYKSLLKEVEDRIKKGISAVKNEKIRLLWDNLPIWFALKDIAVFLAEHNAALVASTYTNAWGELANMMDPEHPLESMAKVYIHPLLNRGTGYKLKIIEDMVKEYSINGVIMHSDRSCKPYSIGQMDQKRKLMESGIPSVLVEADHNDSRSFSRKQFESRLEAFLEALS